jgi:putative peptidoglycan lipid II flippase
LSKLRAPGIAASAGGTILLSFSAQWYILTQLGAGRVSDSYFAALAVPVVILYVLGDPLSRVALPLMSVKDEAEHWTYAWTTIALGLAIFVAIGVVLFTSVPLWVGHLVPGFDANATAATARLIRILVLGMMLQGTGMVARSAWNAKGSFLWPTTAGMIAAASSLLFLLLTLKRSGVAMAAWAFNVRFGVEFLLLLVPLGHFAPPRWTEAPLLLRKARPLMLGAAYFRTDVIVDRVLTSLAPPGSLSLLYLAQQLLSAAGQVINQSVVAPLIPGLARTAHVGDWATFAQSVRTSTWRLLALASVLVLAILLFGKPALGLIFSHRAMGSAEIDRLVMLIFALGGMLLADGIVYFAYSAFYSAGDTLTPTVATAILYSVSIAAKIGAFMTGGLVALAITISAYYIANAVMLQLLLRSRIAKLRAAPAIPAVDLPDPSLALPPTPPIDSY